jgi:uncharacterized protein YkwD
LLKRPQAARLLAVDREAPGTRLLLLARDEAAVGSAEGSKLRVTDPNVAERHAIIRYARGRYYLVDLKSGPGTFVNGRRIRRTQRLKHGDVLRFGGAPSYRFIDPDAQKRRRWRRNLRVGAAAAMLLAFALADHFEQWGLVSVATLSKIVALVESNPTSKRIEPPIAVAVRAPAQAAAPSAPATTMPSPAARASTIAVAAAPVASSTASVGARVAAASASPMTWLERINFYRGSNGLRPIRDNSRLSAAVTAHAHYLLLNFADDIRGAKPIPADAYDEKSGKNGYSVEGAGVAQNLQLAWGCSTYDATQQIDRWLEGPFHRLPMLDPYLADVGYGEVSEDGCWVAALRLPPPPEDVKPYRRAVEFPPEGADIALEWIGLEEPDALASCSGYERPVGLPITLQIGRLTQTRLTNHSLTEDGKPIEYCAFDAPSYRNPNPREQEYGRWNLRNAGAIVLVPRAPLRPGSHYQVSVSTNDVTYAWSFTAARTSETTFSASASFPTPEPIATIRATPFPSARPRRAMSASHRATPAPAASAIISEVRPPILAPPPPPMVEPAPEMSSPGMNWLGTVNLYRSVLKLQPVQEDPGLSQGCRDHAKYLVTNYGSTMRAGINIGSLMHTENESKPGYTPDGIKAARASDVMFQPPQKFSDDQRMTRTVQSWIAGPFHRPSLSNPDLRQVGFGEYCDETVCAAVLDWRSDLEPPLPGGHPYATPVEIPPDGATVKPSGFGGEWPSPTSTCPGYPSNASAITIQVGINMRATVTDASMTQMTGAAAGTKVGTCAYDSQKYTNPDPGTQEHGREVLRAFGEAVMMVRDQLSAGQAYRVDMTVNGKPYTWSFTAAP